MPLGSMRFQPGKFHGYRKFAFLQSLGHGLEKIGNGKRAFPGGTLKPHFRVQENQRRRNIKVRRFRMKGLHESNSVTYQRIRNDRCRLASTRHRGSIFKSLDQHRSFAMDETITERSGR